MILRSRKHNPQDVLTGNETLHVGVEPGSLFEEERPLKPTLRILLIEPDIRRLEALCEVFSRYHHIVFRALTYRLGVQMARLYKPDLILVNADCPGYTTQHLFQATSQLRVDDVTKTIPLVGLVSSYEEHCGPSGCSLWDACVSKSLQAGALVQQVIHVYGELVEKLPPL